jgi:hypothetical protein
MRTQRIYRLTLLALATGYLTSEARSLLKDISTQRRISKAQKSLLSLGEKKKLLADIETMIEKQIADGFIPRQETMDAYCKLSH